MAGVFSRDRRRKSLAARLSSGSRYGLISKERPLDPADYEMIGVLGILTSGIRPGGVGELCFSRKVFIRPSYSGCAATMVAPLRKASKFWLRVMKKALLTSSNRRRFNDIPATV